MTDYEIKLPSELVSSLMSEGSGFAQLLTGVLRPECLRRRQPSRSGPSPMSAVNGGEATGTACEPERFTPASAPLHCGCRSFATGPFPPRFSGVTSDQNKPSFLASWLLSVIAAHSPVGQRMVVNGVSSRKVTKITEDLCGASFSKSTVSQLCTGLDARVRAFNERRLGAFPFLIIDAMYIKARSQHDGVVSKAALMVSGVNTQGNREVLGVRIGDSEAESFWRDTFEWLKERGLSDVAFVVSDDHKGMGAALKRSFQGAIWQRCQVHFMRNILSFTPPRHKAKVAEGLKRIFRADTAAEARAKAAELAEAMEGRADRAIQCLEDGLEDALAVYALPTKYRRRLRTSNMQERLNQEVRRRERVIRIFPNEASALRLIGALLAEINDDWQCRKYLDLLGD